MLSNAFFSDIKFYDDKNFPYQFSRSGDFSQSEADLLTNLGYIMNLLEKRKMLPEKEEHFHFLDVLYGKNKPLYMHEHVYLKYLKLIEKKNTFINNYKTSKKYESSEEYFDDEN